MDGPVLDAVHLSQWEGLEGLGRGDDTGPRLVGGKSLSSMECWVTGLSIFFIAFKLWGSKRP